VIHGWHAFTAQPGRRVLPADNLSTRLRLETCRLMFRFCGVDDLCRRAFSRIAADRRESLKSWRATAEIYHMRNITNCKVHQIRRV